MLRHLLFILPASLLVGTYLFAADSRPARKPGTKWDLMDHGPFLSSHLDATPKVNKAVSINLGNGATVCFDTEMCKLALGWTGGFVKLPTGRDGLEGMPKPDSTNIIFSTPAGPGWADAEGNFSDLRPEFKGRKYGPLPKEHAKWKGIYLDGNATVLSYSVGKAQLLEKPGFADGEWTRTFHVDGADQPLTLVLFRGAKPVVKGGMFPVPKSLGGGAHGTFETGTQAGYIAVTGDLGVKQVHVITTNDVVALRLDVPAKGVFRIAMGFGTKERPRRTPPQGPVEDLSRFTKGGAPRWGEPIQVAGKVSPEPGPYVVDTITVPETNRFNSWIRCSGLDFFSDGSRAAVCSVSGDVWLLSNIDDKLDRVTWKRFATGLFQPLGLRIVDDKVYVLGRDQITRLHDLNRDDEADFYENFNNDVAAFQDYHEFALDLQTDSQGNFYFAKGGNLGNARHPHNGCVIKVSKDGSKLEPIAFGLRAPNGMGVGPNDEISVSDNEGNWVPTSRFSIIKPGGFYGHVNNAFRSPDPDTYDNPVCWLPKNVDNSSGGQVWVTSDKWGPFQGDMLFMSYGHCTLHKVLLDKVDGEYQGGVVKFPLKFDTGIMRGRFNKKDGQLYVTGLVVWQSDGARKGAVHRVRYTGAPVHMPRKIHATKRGVELTFTAPLDEASASDPGNWAVEQWNYKWTRDYGSPEFSVKDAARKGHDKVEVKSVKVSQDRKSVFLEMPEIQPVMQQKISANIKASDGTPVKQEVYHSIYRLAVE